MEDRPYSYLLRTRFFRQVQFYLAGISFPYRHFFVLPRQPEAPLGFIPEIRPTDGAYYCFDRVGCDALFTLPLLLHFHPPRAHTAGLEVKWNGLVTTLSGVAVARFIFGSSSGMIPFAPFWLIVTGCYLAFACLFFPMSNDEARETRKDGFFFLVIGLLIFLQIVITPQAGGPHHYSMIFPLPLLAFAFLAKSLYTQFATENLRRLAALLFGAVAVSLLVVNVHNTAGYLSHFRTNSH